MRRPSPLSRRRVLATGGALLAGSALAGAARAAGLPRVSFVDRLERRVAVVGDSITAESSALLRELLRSDGFADIEIDAERSRRMVVGGGPGEPRSGRSVLEDLVADEPDRTAWVVALGTNDMAMYAEYRDAIDTVLAVIPEVTPLVWVDTYLPGDRLADCESFGREVRTRLAVRGNSSVASWYDACTATDEDLLRSDDIHPNDRGHVVFATLVSTTLRRLVLAP